MVITVPDEDSGKVIAAIDHRAEDIGELSPLSGGFGLAVDIGTTTVAAEIIDLSTGEVIYKAADTNGQRSRGEDVLARIEYAGEGGTAELCDLVIFHIEDVIHFTTRNDQRVTLYEGIDVEECVELVVLGTLVGGNFSCCYFAKDTHNIIQS